MSDRKQCLNALNARLNVHLGEAVKRNRTPSDYAQGFFDGLALASQEVDKAYYDPPNKEALYYNPETLN